VYGGRYGDQRRQSGLGKAPFSASLDLMESFGACEGRNNLVKVTNGWGV